MTSDMGELFNEIKKERQRKSRENWAKHKDQYEREGWAQYTEHHWYKTIMLAGVETIVQFWPSSNKYRVGYKYYRGSLPKALKDLIHRAV